jgi:hypothetical protein
MTMPIDQGVTEADRADARPTLDLTGYSMGQLRTANKRHNRAIVARHAAKSDKAAPIASAKPAKAAA